MSSSHHPLWFPTEELSPREAHRLGGFALEVKEPRKVSSLAQCVFWGAAVRERDDSQRETPSRFTKPRRAHPGANPLTQQKTSTV